jgi:hypothetical protein
MVHTSRVIRCLLIWVCLAATTASPLLWSQTREETSLWDSVKDSKDAEDYKAYLDKYPDGVYAPLAKRRVAQLGAHPSEPATGSQPEKTDLPAGRAKSKPATGAAVNMTECEGTNNCATWTFLGGQGSGQWPSGELASLSVEHSDADTVVIRRADSTGPSAGLTAVYKGTRHGDRVGGEFTSSWPGRWENKTSNWYATIGHADQSPPPVMRVCDPAGACSNWTWNNGHYDGAWNNATATMTVVSFSTESVVIKRVDTGGRPGYYAYVYTGKISSQGNSILNGDWLGEPGSMQAGVSGHYTATWGTALQNNPAARAQPVVIGRPVVCYPWFFTVVCSQ